MIKLVPRIRKIFIKNIKLLSESVCKVTLINPASGSFDYLVPNLLYVGQIVIVPLRKRLCVGIVMSRGTSNITKKKLRYINKIVDLPCLSLEFLNFCIWTSNWTMYDISQVLKMSLPSIKFLETIKEERVLSYNKDSVAKTTPLGLKVKKFVSENWDLSIADCMRKLKVSRSVIDKLIIDEVLINKTKKFKKNNDKSIQYISKKLSRPQLKSYKIIKNFMKKEKNNVFLIDGVTGSGKTEVYFELINMNINSGKQSLILLPEISLSSQFLDRFSKRFGAKAYLWHSDLSMRQRHETWQSVIRREAKVVVGARSALFLPFVDLGLIIVDEEHDISYKQEDGVIYNARDMAVARGSIAFLNVILVSATPSLETLHNVNIKKYKRIEIKERYGSAVMPSIKLVDMRKKNLLSNEWLSDEATNAIKNALKNKEQSLLFINRRGFAPLTLCNNCGYRFCCSECSSWLVSHKQKDTLLCHHCGYNKKLPSSCPNCNKKNSFVACGPGVERLAEEVKKKFPLSRLEILSSDTLKNISVTKNILNDIEEGKIEIVVGTQVVAKGHNFPLLTNVIAIDADLSLIGGDLRASERTFQMLTQLSGRAGRDKKKGHALIQSYEPDNSVMQAIADGDRDKFFALESENRSLRNMPPYGRLAAIIVQSKNITKLETFVKMLAKKKQNSVNQRITVLGPAPAPINKLRGWYRFRFLLKGEKNSLLQPFIKEWLEKVNVRKDIRIKIDIDPYNFL